jgi:hypothetical protein
VVFTTLDLIGAPFKVEVLIGLEINLVASIFEAPIVLVVLVAF